MHNMTRICCGHRTHIICAVLEILFLKFAKEFEILLVKSTIINMAVMQNFEVISDKFNNTKSVPKLCFQH